MDQVIAREYLTRWAASFGLLHSPLTLEDLASSLARRLRGI
jgi:hypothetical protein